MFKAILLEPPGTNAFTAYYNSVVNEIRKSPQAAVLNKMSKPQLLDLVTQKWENMTTKHKQHFR